MALNLAWFLDGAHGDDDSIVLLLYDLFLLICFWNCPTMYMLYESRTKSFFFSQWLFFFSACLAGRQFDLSDFFFCDIPDHFLGPNFLFLSSLLLWIYSAYSIPRLFLNMIFSDVDPAHHYHYQYYRELLVSPF